MFTWLMWLTGVTGFLVTVMVYLTNPPTWAHWTLVIHVIAAIEVLLMLPFSKFAHAYQRPLALWYDQYEKDKADLD